MQCQSSSYSLGMGCECVSADPDTCDEVTDQKRIMLATEPRLQKRSSNCQKKGFFFFAKQWGSVEKEEEKVVNGKGSTYFFAKPKSMMKTWLPRLANPIIKLSGLMSRCKNDLECTYSIRLISWSANNSTVFTVNFREQKLNKSSKDGPSSSITLCSVPRERVVRTRAR